MKHFSKIVATFFGIGYFPLAPGTLASLLIVLLYKFYLHRLGWGHYLLMLAVLFIVGAMTSTVHAVHKNMNDPRCIVIDEVMGQLLVCFRLSPDWPVLIAGFLLFRFFDILKPFVIKKAESIPDGWGIMMDDVAAGLCAAILLNIYLVLR